jgi:uncharacterized protein YhfF
MPVTPAHIDHAAVAKFWNACIAALPQHNLAGKSYALRCIGTSPEMNAAILDNIAQGKKVGTFPLPLQLEKLGEKLPQPGDLTIQLKLDGTPRLLVQTTQVDTLPFRALTAEHTAIDGPTVRPLDIWRKIHIPYYTAIMAEYGLPFSEDVPICIEKFSCLHVAP